MPNRKSLTAHGQELAIDIQIASESGRHDEVPKLAKQVAAIFARLDEARLEFTYRVNHLEDRPQW